MNLNKGVSTPIAILLIVVVSAVVGFLVWQFTRPVEETPKQASDYTTQSSCQEVDYYWYDDACHETKSTSTKPPQDEKPTEEPNDYTTQAACEDAGYYWHEEACYKEEAVSETADWKTYTNEKYGFRIRYPGDWNSRLSKKSELVPYNRYEGLADDVFVVSPAQASFSDFHFAVYSNPEKASLSEFYEGRFPKYSLVKTSQVSLGERGTISGSKFQYKTKKAATPDSKIVVATEKGDYIIEIEDVYGSSLDSKSKVFERMLSTFEFVN